MRQAWDREKRKRSETKGEEDEEEEEEEKEEERTQKMCTLIPCACLFLSPWRPVPTVPLPD